MRRLNTGLVIGAAVLLAAAVSPSARAQGPESTVWDGVYTDAQAERGGKRYADACSMCHGAEMTGGGGVPGLKGAEFLFAYNNGPLSAVFDYIKANMPPGQAGSLSDQQYTDILAAMLKTNGFPASETTELPSDVKALTQIRVLRNKP
jgi:mono/diheme cytochrome c family protein